VTRGKSTSWYSENGYLELNPEDKGYKKNALYTVSLVGPRYLEYELIYSTQNTIKKLENNVQ